jgi:hypothetical protein
MSEIYARKGRVWMVRKALLLRAYETLIENGFTGFRAAQVLQVPQSTLVRWRKAVAR